MLRHKLIDVWDAITALGRALKALVSVNPKKVEADVIDVPILSKIEKLNVGDLIRITSNKNTGFIVYVLECHKFKYVALDQWVLDELEENPGGRHEFELTILNVGMFSGILMRFNTITYHKVNTT